ncbi:MAG TPA: hypothetical protein PK006_08085 [Saprospiraceae bacterium]|nr:hypothetical protein [Saprospiraceae bacterium]
MIAKILQEPFTFTKKYELMIQKLHFVFALMVFAFVIACKDNNNTNTNVDCTGVISTYSLSVKVILDASCAFTGCHAGANPAAKIDLSNYTGAKAAATTGNKFVCSITHGSGCNPMPSGGAKLDASLIKVLQCWVQSGAPQ